MSHPLLVAAVAGALGVVTGGVVTWLALTAPVHPAGPHPDPLAPPALRPQRTGVVVPLRVVA